MFNHIVNFIKYTKWYCNSFPSVGIYWLMLVSTVEFVVLTKTYFNKSKLQSAEIQSNGIAYLEAISNVEKVNISSPSVTVVTVSLSQVVNSVSSNYCIIFWEVDILYIDVNVAPTHTVYIQQQLARYMTFVYQGNHAQRPQQRVLHNFKCCHGKLGTHTERCVLRGPVRKALRMYRWFQLCLNNCVLQWRI